MTAFLNLLLGSAAVYANIFHKDLFTQYINIEYAFLLNIVIIYISKDPNYEVQEGLTKFSYLMRLHKYFIFNALYATSLIPDYQQLFKTLLTILIIHSIGLIIPKNLLLNIAKFPLIKSYLTLCTAYMNVNVVLNIMKLVILNHLEKGSFTAYFFP